VKTKSQIKYDTYKYGIALKYIINVFKYIKFTIRETLYQKQVVGGRWQTRRILNHLIPKIHLRSHPHQYK